MKLDVKAFAITCGILWGIALFLMTWWIIVFEGVTAEPTFLGRFYFGYEITPLGSLIGFLWAAVDGLVGGAVFAWLYNQVQDRLSRRA